MEIQAPLPRLAITPGEPAGIGPQLVAALANTDLAADLVVIADPELLHQTSQQFGLSLVIEPYSEQPIQQRPRSHLRCLPIALGTPAIAGKLNAANAQYVIETLTRGCDGCLREEFDALVTGPVHKGVINEAGIHFTGHTEFFAERTHSDVVMLLATTKLRVALATTHIPLANVASAITRTDLTRTLQILHSELQTKFKITQPRIAVLGLNPHAGENGYLGREEIDVIIPTLDALRATGLSLLGPLSADTAFVPQQLARYDAVLAMYHDQGLPALKMLGFGDTVNISLGLPFIRTSVDHGTALDLAGSQEHADPSSLIAAAKMALELVIAGRDEISRDIALRK